MIIDRFIRYASRARQPYLWEGIYNEYRDVPAKGEAFESEAWILRTRQYTAGALEALHFQPDGVPSNIPSYHSLFSLAVALLRQRQERLRVLDFGGGMGLAFANLLRSLGEEQPNPPIDYLVIDSEKSCREGAELFSLMPGVQFSSTLPQDVGHVDIILLSGVLQFVEDYKSILKTLAALTAPYWLFTFVPTGDIPTFASGQKNVPGSTIPVWFFNLGELLEIMRLLGYQLIFKAPLERKFEMGNFPLTHRLPQQCNLLFKRNDNQRK
jgi:putative methyltransferase (TIGR04325 family)